MTENKALTLEKFHEILHKDINKPTLNFRKKWIHTRFRTIKPHADPHKASWAKATIFSQSKVINVRVNVNFKQNDLSSIDYENLKILARSGISQYWSRRINLNGHRFMVWVNVYHSFTNAIPVDFYIETDENNYARSMNPATLGIDASFIYNKGAFRGNQADLDFKLVSAHEFGHSVLMYAGKHSLSWGHKGSTNAITQSVKSSVPGYPAKGLIDLMKYYDTEKSTASLSRRARDTLAMEMDIKRLIWSSKILWIK